jgi:hypothetical protein
MPAPTVISTSPASGARDIVLGAKIIIGFSAPMDLSTINSTTFSLTGPGQTSIIVPQSLIVANPKLLNGREYIEGTFAFTAATNGNTILTFTPSVPLRPNVVYTLLIVGPGQLTSDSIKDLNGLTLAYNYQWSFTTGDLNLVVPPAQSPLPVLNLPLSPGSIKIEQRLWAIGNDLSQEIDVIFPGAIDTSSVTAEQILLSLEPILNDPMVQVPAGLTPTVTISGNKITILISGWPLDS